MDLCTSDATDIITSNPRKLSALPPKIDSPWKRASLLHSPVQSRLRQAFEALGHHPFRHTQYAHVTGTSHNLASSDIRNAFLAGILKKGAEPFTYRFRKTAAQDGWHLLHEYGDVVNSSYLKNAHSHFQGRVFRTQEFIEALDLSDKSKAIKILSDGTLVNVLHRIRRGTYVFIVPPPDDSEIPSDVWHKAPFLGDAVSRHLKKVFESIPRNQPFTTTDYAKKAGIDLRMASREVREVILAGIVRRVEGDRLLLVFRETLGPSGLEAFIEYGPSANTTVQNLAQAFAMFGTDPFNRKDIQKKLGITSISHIEMLLKEGSLTGILIKKPDHHYSFSEPFTPDLHLIDRPHGPSQESYSILEDLQAPLEVWENAAQLTDVVANNLIHVFQELRYNSFSPEDFARLTGLSLRAVNTEMRLAFFAGLLQRENNLYKFRERKTVEGWEILHEYGLYAERLISYLEKSFNHFKDRPFTFEDFLAISDPLTKEDAHYMIRETRLTGLLQVDEGGFYIFTSPHPGKLPQKTLAVLQDIDIEPDIWKRGHHLGRVTLDRLTRALETYKSSPFKSADYTALTGISNRNEYLTETRYELKLACLAGILRRVGDGKSYMFRASQDTGGWDAFYEYGIEARRSVRLLRTASKIFGGKHHDHRSP